MALKTEEYVSKRDEKIYNYQAELKEYPTLHHHTADDDLNIDYNFLITGGYRPKKQNLTKYLVSISSEKMTKFFGDGHFCGGSIIKPNVIVTAAHCIRKDMYGLQMLRSVIVIAGTPNRFEKTPKTQVMKVKRYVVYHASTGGESADIALIVLQKNIRIDGVTTDILPLADKPPKAWMHCTVVGWGRVFDHGPLVAEPLYVDLDMWSIRKCASYKRFYEPSLLCAGVLYDPDRDSCSGDSGGPLICEGKLYGIVSFGIGCGTPGFPGFYTNVFRYLKWIAENRADFFGINYSLIVFMGFCLTLL
ncbi:PREDICTED: trypsin I-P1-like [Rhagoletis zephyria]|uniref:trypsin I-P1-like n=1 Tax=Rhagoletis zephyria TaxID=28612 RepID=UPI0008114B8F|nr:PREDICTED: trypsin I-P1-like [Rhagoletis zephyria]